MAMGGRVDDHVRINVSQLTDELQKMVYSNGLSTHSPPQCCIFRVPNVLSRHNPEAYRPNAFSIGPFHYGKPGLQETQKIKLKYLRGLLRCGRENKVTLRNLTEAIIEAQEAARSCYAGDIGMSREDFVKVMVVDGCFLIELFRKNRDSKLREEHDPIFAMSCQIQFLYHDLILLANQIPWLVLDRLFSKVTAGLEHQYPDSLVELAIHFFSDQSCFLPGIRHDTNLIPTLATKVSRLGSKHILDLLRKSMVLNFSVTENQNSEWKTMPSARSLTEAGIKFKEGGSPSQSESLLGIKFEGGVLEIPPLIIHEHTEPLFWNLIGLEQCLPNCAAIVTSYARLLDNLINTTEDMEILCKHGIVQNWLNVDDATKVFNKLYDDTFVKDFYYTTLNDQVNEYCRRRWPKYRTVLMHDYFRHPWALISVIAATILLTLAFLQTLFAMP